MSYPDFEGLFYACGFQNKLELDKGHFVMKEYLVISK